MKESPEHWNHLKLFLFLIIFDWNTWLNQSISLRNQLLNQTGAFIWILTGIWVFRNNNDNNNNNDEVPSRPNLPRYEAGEKEEKKTGRPTHLWYVDWCGRWTKVTWETQTSPASTRGGWLDNRQVALAVALFLSHLDLKHRINPSQISN